MTGALLFALLLLWVLVSAKLARALARKVSSLRAFRAPFAVAIFAVLLVLPIADEVVGGFQFRFLCARDAALVLGVPNPEGRLARYEARPSNARVPRTAIPILHSHVEYRDANTTELIAGYDSFVAKGGLLVRTFGISESNSPLTIGSPACSGEGPSTALPVRLKFQVTD